MQTAAKSQADKMSLLAKQKLEGMRIGAEIGRAKSQMKQQSNSEDKRILADLVKQKKEHEKQTPPTTKE